MIELIQELDTASSLLSDALRRYIAACHAIKNFYWQSNGIPHALSNRVANELRSVISYETNIRQAKSIVGQTRNCSPTLSPIQSLPPEVLASVFQIVVGVRPCGIKAGDSSGTNASLTKYPDLLSQVCSRWRRVAIGLPKLWSHIDIVRYHPLSPGSIDRAKICIYRAGKLPLDLHIRVPASQNFCIGNPLDMFLASIATRTRSIELVIPSTIKSFEGSFLEDCFRNLVPSTFTKLTITDAGRYTPNFFIASDSSGDADSEDSEDDYLRLRLPHQRFEDLLMSVTNLRLDGLFPRWTSQVYHGLVELHLTSTRSPDFQILESELRGILAFSPMLRIIEFGLEITVPPSENRGDWQLPPVYLGSLEILNLSSLNYHQLEPFLKLLDPGPKPLQLTVAYHDNMSRPVQEDGVVKFFKRSRITNLRAMGFDQSPRVRFNELLNHRQFPHLQVLVLEEFGNWRGPQSFKDPPKRGALSRDSRLDVLCLLHCQLELADIRWLVEEHSPQLLVLWRVEVYRNQEYLLSTETQIELSRLGPAVKILRSEDPNPIENWD